MPRVCLGGRDNSKRQGRALAVVRGYVVAAEGGQVFWNPEPGNLCGELICWSLFELLEN